MAIEVPATVLRQKMAEYLKRALEGEDVVVTKYGKPVVRLVLIPSGE